MYILKLQVGAMKESEKHKHFDTFDKSVKWLRRVVPPDDIYDFAEQALLACDYFIHKLKELTDLPSEQAKDKILNGWLRNVMGMRVLKEQVYDGIISVSMKVIDEDSNSRDSSSSS